jgi:general stress protein 26
MNGGIGLGLFVGVVVLGIATAAEPLHEEIVNALKTESYIYVATKRLNGEWSTAAPVWFMYDGEGLYFTTAPSSRKAHRIHRGSPVKIWVGTRDGPSFEGKAQFVKDGALAQRMGKVYSDKYWIAWLGFFRPRPARVGSGKTLLVKVTPYGQPPEPGASEGGAPRETRQR